jgi:hypothetical protein
MNYFQQYFYYPEVIYARVIYVWPCDQPEGSTPNPNVTREPRCDVQSLDQRAFWRRVPILLPRGFTSLPRLGQIVMLGFVGGRSQHPVVLGHTYNTDTAPSTADNMPLDDGGKSIVQNVDDVVIHHDETKTYLRIRNVNSTPALGAGDTTNSVPNPSITEIITATGHHVTIDETSGKQQIKILTSGGHVVTMDDAGKKLSLASSGGHTIVADDNSATQGITAKSTSGHMVHLDDQNKQVAVVSTGGHATVLDDAKKLISIVTTGGHKALFDDGNKIVSLLSSGGHKALLDDANKIFNMLSAGGHQTLMDDGNKLMKLLSSSGNEHIILDAAGGIISHSAKNVGVGADFASLSSINNAITKTHFDSFTSNLNTQRLSDMIKLVNGLAGVGVPNAANLLPQLVTGFLQSMTGPTGAGTVRLKSS